MDDSLLKNKNRISVKKIIDGINRIFISVAIFCLLAVPIIVSVFDKNELSFPERFIGRDYLISMVNNFRYFTLEDMAFADTLITENGWVIPTDLYSMHDYQNTFPFTEIATEQIGLKLSSFCAFLTQYDIEFIFVVPPNKNTIYPEYIPSEIQKFNANSRLDQVIQVWNETDNCHLLDLRTRLTEAKQYGQIYYSTDTHWNQLGIFYAHQELTSYLSNKFPGIQVPNLNNYYQEEKLYFGDLIGNFHSHINNPEIENVFRPTQPCNCFGDFMMSADGVSIGHIYNTNDNLPVAMIYYDSFVVNWVPFLNEIFQEAYYFRTVLGQPIVIDQKKIIFEQPDVVIIESTERLIDSLLSLPDPTEYTGNN